MKTVKQFGLHNLRKGIKILFPKKSYIICTNYEIDVSNKIATISEVDYRGAKWYYDKKTYEKTMVIYVKFHDKEISRKIYYYHSKRFHKTFYGETYFSHKDNGEGGTDIDYLLKAKIIEEDL